MNLHNQVPDYITDCSQEMQSSRLSTVTCTFYVATLMKTTVFYGASV